MSTLWIFLGAGTVMIVGVEFAMWRIFAIKAQGLPLLRAADESSLPFFTLARLRLGAVGHGVGMLVILYALTFYFW